MEVGQSTTRSKAGSWSPVLRMFCSLRRFNTMMFCYNLKKKKKKKKKRKKNTFKNKPKKKKNFTFLKKFFFYKGSYFSHL